MPLLKISQDKDLKTVINFFDGDLAASKSSQKKVPVKRLPLSKAGLEVVAPQAAPAPEPAAPSSQPAPTASRGKSKDISGEDALAFFGEDAFKNPVVELSSQKKRDYGFGVPQW